MPEWKCVDAWGVTFFCYPVIDDQGDVIELGADLGGAVENEAEAAGKGLLSACLPVVAGI